MGGEALPLVGMPTSEGAEEKAVVEGKWADPRHRQREEQDRDRVWGGEAMSAADRSKHLRIVAEIMLVHLPSVINDQALARDLLSVVGVTIRAAFEDAERSASAWDKKAYHVKADRLRDEWGWALGAANYAEGLAYRDTRVSSDSLRKLRLLIKPEITASSRRIPATSIPRASAAALPAIGYSLKMSKPGASS